LVATLSDLSALPGFIGFDDEMRGFEFAPNDNSQIGVYNIKVVVTDDDAYSSGGVESCEGDFELHVYYTNHAPYFDSSHADWECFVHTDDTYTLPSVSDIDGDTVTRAVDLGSGASLPSFVTFNTGVGTLLCSTIDNGDVGTYTIWVTAEDDDPQGSA